MRVAVLDDYTGWVKDCTEWVRLRGTAEITFFSDHLASEEALAARLATFDVVVLERERTPFAGSLMRRLPRLKLIVSTGPVNWSIDLATASALGIAVACTRSTYDETPELTWGLILSLSRRIGVEEQALRAGQWQTGIGRRLAGKTLGILGLGNVGRRLADFGRCFNMEVIAWSHHLTRERAEASGARHVDLPALLAQSDVLCICTVLSDRTRGLIGAAELAQMRPSALLLNTARAAIVDNEALERALREGRLAGAALDVFPVEPLPEASSLRSVPNLIMTPHIGYVTTEQYEVFYRDVVDNIANFIDGREIRKLVMAEE